MPPVFELALIPAGAVLLAFAVYRLAEGMAEGDGPGLSLFGGVFLSVVFAALVGGALWADLEPDGPAPARRSTLLLPTLGAVAVLGVRSGLRKRRPTF